MRRRPRATHRLREAALGLGRGLPSEGERGLAQGNRTGNLRTMSHEAKARMQRKPVTLPSYSNRGKSTFGPDRESPMADS